MHYNWQDQDDEEEQKSRREKSGKDEKEYIQTWEEAARNIMNTDATFQWLFDQFDGLGNIAFSMEDGTYLYDTSINGIELLTIMLKHFEFRKDERRCKILKFMIKELEDERSERNIKWN